jgi:blue copper oxidase
MIKPGATWRGTLAIDQPAATLWYHPHPHHPTARQTYLGLAGLIIVEDGNHLGLPHDFGIDDCRSSSRTEPSGPMDQSTTKPTNSAPFTGAQWSESNRRQGQAGWVQLRLLNGANGQNFDFRFRDQRIFHSDGGLLSRPVPKNRLLISPAARFEPSYIAATCTAYISSARFPSGPIAFF